MRLDLNPHPEKRRVRHPAKRYGEKSVALKVDAALRFGAENKAHGTSEMPVWGPLFSATDKNQQQVAMRISNLAKYVDSLQQK